MEQNGRTEELLLVNPFREHRSRCSSSDRRVRLDLLPKTSLLDPRWHHERSAGLLPHRLEARKAGRETVMDIVSSAAHDRVSRSINRKIFGAMATVAPILVFGK